MAAGGVVAASRRTRSRWAAPSTLALGALLPWILFFAFANFGRYVLVNPLAGVSDTGGVGTLFSRWKQGAALLVLVYGASQVGLWSRGLTAGAGVVAFSVYACMTNLWSVDAADSSRYSILLILLVLSVAVLLSLRPRREVMGAMVGVVAAVCVASAAAALLLPHIGRHQSSDLLQSVHAGRWRGIMGHKNLLGIYAVLGVVLTFVPGLTRWPPWVLWTARVSALACMVFSGDASALVGALSSGAVVLLLRDRRNAHPARLTALALVLGPAIVLMSWAAPILAGWLGRDPTFSGRTEIWAGAFQVWLTHNPLIGNGYSVGDTHVIAPVLTRTLFQSATTAHNGYLSMLVDVGLVGVLLFSVSVMTALAVALRRLPTESDADYAVSLAGVVVIICALAGAASENATFELFGTGWLTLSACMLLMRTGDDARSPASFPAAARRRAPARLLRLPPRPTGRPAAIR